MADIVMITTGGTIEKTYDEREGSLENREVEIRNRIHAKLRLPATRLHIRRLMAKDSLQMTAADRRLVVDALGAELGKGFPIVVLHGTDTLERTLDLAFSELPDPPVPVVFTGAMRPVEFEGSDALQNVTEALLAAQLLPGGFYVSFHNRVLRAPGIRKNRATGTFERAE